MSRAFGLRPSGGFVFLVVSHVLLISMLAWGYSKPELDQIWLIIQRMQRDHFAGLSARDVRTIRKSLGHNPGLSRAFIGPANLGFVEPSEDGWVRLSRAHLIIDGQSQGTAEMTVECRAPQSQYPVTVSFDGEVPHQSLQFTAAGQKNVVLQVRSQSGPNWVQVNVEPKHEGSRQPMVPEIRVRRKNKPEPSVAP